MAQTHGNGARRLRLDRAGLSSYFQVAHAAVLGLAVLALSCGPVVVEATSAAGGGVGGVGGVAAGGNSTAAGAGGQGTAGAGGAPITFPDGFGLPCPNGNECPVEVPACVKGGEWDLDPYCSRHDCTSESECPTGFHCGVTRDPRAVCGSDSITGGTPLCGEQEGACVEPATLGAGGDTLFEGALCLLRHTCLQRGPCAPCKSDVDCSLFLGQRCVEVGGEGRCAADCAMETDCAPHETCSDKSCVPKFGACVGQGSFCHPCLNDADCGGPGGKVMCYRIWSEEFVCLDFAFPFSCATDLDCPLSPSGKHGTCLDEAAGIGPADPYYGKCFVPIDPDTGERSCW